MPYQQILQKYAYQGIFACRIHICDENGSKSYDFVEKCKKMEKLIILVISVNFLRFSHETLEQNIRKSQKICFLGGKEDKQSKIRNFQIFKKINFIARIQPMTKLKVIMPYQQILQKYALLGYFCYAEFISAMKTVQNPMILLKNAKKWKN